MIGRFPPHVEAEELRSYGVLGLLTAVRTYDPERATLRTHAAFRIRNSIFDELRKQDWAPKTFRARVKEVERTANALREKNSAEPTDAEIGQALDADSEYVRQLRHESRTSHHKSLGELVDDNGEQVGSLPQVSVPVEVSQEVRAHLQAFGDWLDTLSNSQRLVWALRYYQKMLPSQIAEATGIKQSVIAAELRLIMDSFDSFIRKIRDES